MDEPIIVVSAFPERREALAWQLERAGHDPAAAQWIEAPRGAEVLSTHPRYRACHRWLDPLERRPLTCGELACYAGHRDAWARVAELDRPCVVLEDDAELLAPLDRHGFRGEACYLGGRMMREPSVVADGWRSADYVYHCVAIRYTPWAARQLLEATDGRPALPVDEILPWHCAYHGNPSIRPALHGVAGRAGIEAWAVPEWIVAQSGDFRGTETGDSPVELRTLVPASDPERARETRETVEAYRAMGYAPREIGAGRETWDTGGPGGGPKLRWLLEAVREMPPDAWALCVDGHDTLPCVGPDEALRRILELDADIVLGGESNFWPPPLGGGGGALRERLDARHASGPTPDAPHRYPNSGVVAGTAAALRAALESDPRVAEGRVRDDQAWWQARAADAASDRHDGIEGIRVDAEGYLSMQAHGAEASRRNGRPYDAGTRCYPAIAHANGPASMDAVRPLPALHGGADPGADADAAAAAAWREVAHPQAGDWLEVASGILAMPFLQPAFCARLLASADRVPSLWQALDGDPVPGDELRVRALDRAAHEMLEALLERVARPALEARWRPATWSGLKDLFLIRYQRDRQGDIGLHCDRSHFSCSVVLRRACDGGELAFPRQSWTDADIGAGWLLAWPAPITHPHMVHPVRRGKRVSLVAWTGER